LQTKLKHIESYTSLDKSNSISNNSNLGKRQSENSKGVEAENEALFKDFEADIKEYDDYILIRG
jgi:hypothetical protein